MWAGLVASALLGLACWPLAGRALYGGAFTLTEAFVALETVARGGA